MKEYLLECCVDSVESAIAGQKGGAGRLELCGNLVIGGTTPDINLFLSVKEKVSIKTNVLIRPRFGDFLYTDEEFNIIKKDIEMFKKYGANGVVIGILKEDGDLDVDRMKELVQLARPMDVTLHRAFDVCRDPFKTLQDAIDLGINTILTSGQRDSSLDGKELLGKLVDMAEGKVDIMIGGGVKGSIIEELVSATGARTYHMSGSVKLDSPMIYRKENVYMGLPEMSEYTIYRTDENEVAKVRNILDRL